MCFHLHGNHYSIISKFTTHITSTKNDCLILISQYFTLDMF